MWERDDERVPASCQIRDIILSPTGKELHIDESDVDLRKVKRNRFKRHFPSFPFAETGFYTFITQTKDERSDSWKEVSRFTIKVIVETKIKAKSLKGKEKKKSMIDSNRLMASA